MNVEEWTITINVAAADALAVLDSVTEKVRTLANEKQWQSVQQTFDAKPVVNFDNAVEHVLITVDSAAKETAAGVDKVTKAGEEAESAFEGVLKGIGGAAKSFFSREWITGFIDLITTIPDIIKWIGAEQEKAREAERQREAERKQVVYDEAGAEKERYQRLLELGNQYDALARKEKPTIDDAAQLSRVRRELADSYGIEEAAVGNIRGEYEALNRAIKEQKQVELSELFFKQNDATLERLASAKDATEDLYISIAKLKILKSNQSLETLNLDFNSRGADEIFNQLTTEFSEAYADAYKELSATKQPFTVADIIDKMLEGEKEKLSENIGLFSAWLAQHFEQHLTALARDGVVVPDDLATNMLEQLLGNFDPTQFDSWEALESTMRAVMESMRDTFENEGLMENLEILQQQMAAASIGLQPDAEAINGAWEAVLGEESPLIQAMLSMPEFAGESEAAVRAFVAACLGLDGMGDSAGTTLEYLSNTADAFLKNTEQAQDVFAALAEGGREMGEQFESYTGDVKGFLTQLDKLGNQRTALNNLKQLSAQLKTSKKGTKEYDDTLSEINKELKKTDIATDGLGDNMEHLDDAIAEAEKGMQGSASSIAGSLQGIIGWAEKTKAKLILEGGADVDTSPAIAALNGLISVARIALGFLKAIGWVSEDGEPSPSGGGGGGKKDDAEEAARAAEEARKEAIRRDYDMIDHKRHMNEITLEEELELLEAIRRNHQLNAEEIMDWEEKVYDLKKELRERDAESIDQLGDAVVDALEARYEAMRDAELERLDASREAWEKWRDDSVKAIEDQIDALDKLSETEDREKKDAEELRKIAKLRQQIEFEQDDYNRAKLQQQLEQALSSREDRLHKLALEDQKDALREQIEQIEQKADDEISAIDKEQDEIEKAYDERLKEAALRAEAEKLMMTQSQQQILDLLKEYAPDYDATGQTLGEKLLEGFQKKVGGIADWFKSFNAQMAKAQEQMAAMAQEAAGTFYRQQSERNQTQSAVPPTVVNQTVQFNEPVESPSQVARRIEQVNEELSVLLS